MNKISKDSIYILKKRNNITQEEIQLWQKSISIIHLEKLINTLIKNKHYVIQIESLSFKFMKMILNIIH